MTVCKKKSLSYNEHGASMLEVLLAMAIVAMATPFLYSQISDTNDTLRDIAAANEIIDLRNPVLNFVRLNQNDWPDVAQIKLSDSELDEISVEPTAGFIDKYVVNGATITDVYLAFDLGNTDLRTTRIARHIGVDAAVVGNDGIAYGGTWAVAAPDFKPGNLIYRISRDLDGEDKTKYLHRTESGEEKLNTMMRDLNMNNERVYDAGGIIAKSAKIGGVSAQFVDSELLTANTLYFSSGANLDGDSATFGSVRVTGDISGFRNIYADTLNGRGYTTAGRIIADRATVVNSVNVGNNLTLKSDSTRTISGFTGITAHTVETSYISTDQIVFYENFGLTVSGELLYSTTAPIKFGNWTFPSLTPPRFSELVLDRATVPAMVVADEFSVIMSPDWVHASQMEIQ
mgnify:CR=1 FL=1